jgi:hypothetical protein
LLEEHFFGCASGFPAVVSTPGQEWINQFASLLADPHSQVLGVCLTDGFWDAINTKKPSP